MKKILFLLCLVLMLSVCFVACGNDGGSTTDITGGETPAATTEAPTVTTGAPSGDTQQPDANHVHSAPTDEDLLALTANGSYTCTACGKAGTTLAETVFDYSVKAADSVFNAKLPTAVAGTVKSIAIDGTNYYTDGALKPKSAVVGENRVVTLVTESDEVYYYLANVYTDIIASAEELLNFTYCTWRDFDGNNS